MKIFLLIFCFVVTMATAKPQLPPPLGSPQPPPGPLKPPLIGAPPPGPPQQPLIGAPPPGPPKPPLIGAPPPGPPKTPLFDVPPPPPFGSNPSPSKAAPSPPSIYSAYSTPQRPDPQLQDKGPGRIVPSPAFGSNLPLRVSS